MSVWIVGLCAVGLVAAAAGLWARLTPAQDEFMEGKNGVRVRRYPAISITNSGGFVVRWSVRDVVFAPDRPPLARKGRRD